MQNSTTNHQEHQSRPSRQFDSREHANHNDCHFFPGLDPRFVMPAISAGASHNESVAGFRRPRTDYAAQTLLLSSSRFSWTRTRTPGTWAFEFDSSSTRLGSRVSEEESEPISPKTTTATNRAASTPPSTPKARWRFGPIGTQAFDVTTSSIKRKREESHVRISPKTITVLQRQRAIYHLPAFLEEEIAGESAEVNSDDADFDEDDAGEDAGYDADNEVTPTQESFMRYQYYGGGNYLLPARSEAGRSEWRRVETENFNGNAWPPAMLKPVA